MNKPVIDWKNPQEKISRYFSTGEVTKGDLRRIPVDGSEIERNILKLAVELDNNCGRKISSAISVIPAIAKLVLPNNFSWTAPRLGFPIKITSID